MPPKDARRFALIVADASALMPSRDDELVATPQSISTSAPGSPATVAMAAALNGPPVAGEFRMLAQEAVDPSRGIEQMQGDGVGHDLAHQAHDFELEAFLQLRILVEEGDPLMQGQLGHPGLGHRDDAVRCRGFELPGRVAGFHAALVGKAQDHFLGLLVGDHAFENAVEDEVLLHLVHALVQEEVALLAIDHGQMRFQGGNDLLAQAFQDDVLRQLHANDIAILMVGN